MSTISPFYTIDPDGTMTPVCGTNALCRASSQPRASTAIHNDVPLRFPGGVHLGANRRVN